MIFNEFLDFVAGKRERKKEKEKEKEKRKQNHRNRIYINLFFENESNLNCL